jgi:hypothetical protein
MAKLGSPQTAKFRIGTVEARIGPLTLANKLLQTHSIGLIDNASIEVAQDSVDLLSGFPRVPADTAITSQNATFTATLREYSRRNLRTLLGESVETSPPSDNASLVVDDSSAGDTSVDVTASDGANFTEGEIVVIYPDGFPEQVTVARIASISTDTLSLDSGTPTLWDYAGTTTTVHIYSANPVAIGGLTANNYFALTIVTQERGTNRPVGYSFWKGTIAAGATESIGGTDDFSSTDMSVKLLAPAASEYGAGGSLLHLANVIPNYPIGMRFAGAD